MPRPGPRKPNVVLRLDQDDIDWFDRRALIEEFTIRHGEPNRSEVMRLALCYARRHMPVGWRPGRGV